MDSGNRRQWMAACVLGTLLATGAVLSAAVRNGAVTVPTSTGGGVRYPDVAYDALSNSYLTVTGKGKVQGAWVTGGAGIASGTFNLTPSTAYQQAPAAECGENGVCLVVWHEGGNGTMPMARVLSRSGGFLSSPVAIGPLGSNWEMTPGVAYSPDANVFMVTWMGDYLAATNKNNIWIAVVNLSGQLIFRGRLTSGDAYERQPTVGYNPATHEFLVAYCGVVSGGAYAYVRGQRVSSTGAMIGGAIALDQASADYIASVDFNTQTQTMLASWNRGSRAIYGRQVNGNGTVGSLLTLSSTYGAYDALDSAYNPNTKSYLFVTHGPSVEDIGIEVSSANASMGAFTLTNNGGTGNFNPRVARSTASTGWLAVTSKSFAALVAQAASSTTDAGLGGGTTAPPPPPPGCTISTSPTSASLSSLAGTGSISVTVSTSPCSWTATSNVSWLTVSPASGTSAATITWTAQANATGSTRTATVSVAGHTTTISQSAASTTTNTGALQFDGSGGGDFLTYNRSSGAWAVRLYNGSPFTTGGSGTWSAGWQIYPAKFDTGPLVDLFYYNPATGAYRKGLNIGGGTFSIYSPPANLETGWSVTVLDLNGDGLSDVFLYNPTSGAWKRGISSSGATNFTFTTGTWSPGWQVFRANLNNDGRDDLFLYKPSGTSAGQWARALSQSDGTFSIIPGNTTWEAGWQVYPGNYDGTGVTSLFLYRNTDGHAMRVTFTSTSATYQSATWGTTWSVRTGDINGDGKTDLFLYDPATGRWTVPISSAGWFAVYPSGTTVGTAWDLRVLYLDGDTKADVLWYKPSTGQTRVWIAQSPTTYGEIAGPTIGTGLTLVTGSQ